MKAASARAKDHFRKLDGLKQHSSQKIPPRTKSLDRKIDDKNFDINRISKHNSENVQHVFGVLPTPESSLFDDHISADDDEDHNHFIPQNSDFVKHQNLSTQNIYQNGDSKGHKSDPGHRPLLCEENQFSYLSFMRQFQEIFNFVR